MKKADFESASVSLHVYISADNSGLCHQSPDCSEIHYHPKEEMRTSPKGRGFTAKGTMKRIFTALMALMLVVSMTACGGSDAGKESTGPKDEATQPITDQPPSATPDEKPSGIQDDGIGEDPTFGEGIGEVVALSEEEKAYVIAQTTNTWLELSPIEKDDLVVLIGRWLEDSSGFIVESYEDLVVMLDHQMEQYFKNGVNESVLATVCDICSAAMPDDALPVG